MPICGGWCVVMGWVLCWWGWCSRIGQIGLPEGESHGWCDCRGCSAFTLSQADPADEPHLLGLFLHTITIPLPAHPHTTTNNQPTNTLTPLLDHPRQPTPFRPSSSSSSPTSSSPPSSPPSSPHTCSTPHPRPAAMTKRLKIMIGPNRQQMEIAHVNDSAQPTIINSEYFVGRVLIKIRDFEGITHDGSPPIRNHVYFDGRSRKFDIQIEGRFKKRDGVQLYSGEEIHFGSDFDHIVDFPKSAFNAGMRVARWIDPNVFYDLTPPSERPFIMSPYLACMNTLCAWPCPDRLSDALVCLRQSDREDDHHNTLDSEADDMVPMEQVDPAELGATAGKKKIGRHPRRYWRFIGLKSDHARIDAFIAKNSHLLAQPLHQQDSLLEGPQPPTLADNLATGQTTDNEDDEFDDADALSCRAPSSYATYSTAIEGMNDSRPALNSASSYRFSPRRIFPRHQISLGAGMRDLYQDAEIEANEREGEAQAHRMIEINGEDDSMPAQRPSPGPPSPSGAQESEEALKKSSNKVKHGLKKLKIAFKKITPSLSSSAAVSATSATPSPPTNTPSKRKSYSTAFSTKTRSDTLGSPVPSTTVSRAASRRLPPGPLVRDSSQTLRTDSRSTETVKNLGRSCSLMPRPQSHYHPASTVLPDVSVDEQQQQQQQGKARSTSLDHTRSFDFASTMAGLKMQSTESSLFTIHQAAAASSSSSSSSPGQRHRQEPAHENGSPRQGSSGRLSMVKSDKEASTRLSSPSTASHSRSTRTSATSCSDVDEQSAQTVPGESRFTELASHGSQDAREPEPPGLSSSPTAASAQLAGSPAPSSSSHTPVGHSRASFLGPDEPATTTTTPLEEPAALVPAAAAQTSSPTLASPSQTEIDEAPVLEDVEVGDLMFANMLNLAPDTTTTTASAAAAASQDPVQELLGPWRFKNPTTDILEDNTFVFLDKSVNVQKRRKHFSESGGKHRKAFVYDPDVVYATSFFSPFMDFNTFDLAIGPVKINVAKVFGDMPVRYTLRSTRIDAQNNVEEEIFVTISFELVDA
ncbi:hypothetical protein PtB15_1B490 [Puccinia triticina]|nr:hypothetical protein PtB15_1B490 [Puccinia triticina]